MLAKGLDVAGASAMQSALAAEGVKSEVVEDASLTELPAPKQLTKVTFTEEALQMEDLLGHGIALEWQEICVIAAGRVKLTEFKTELTEEIKSAPGSRDYSPRLVLETKTIEEHNDHLLLEIITNGAAWRCHTVAARPEAAILFQSLGDRRRMDPAANLSLFVRELSRFAPSAHFNQGAQAMFDSGKPPFCYASQTAFYREITWLLWMISSRRMPQDPIKGEQ